MNRIPYTVPAMRQYQSETRIHRGGENPNNFVWDSDDYFPLNAEDHPSSLDMESVQSLTEFSGLGYGITQQVWYEDSGYPIYDPNALSHKKNYASKSLRAEERRRHEERREAENLFIEYVIRLLKEKFHNFLPDLTDSIDDLVFDLQTAMQHSRTSKNGKHSNRTLDNARIYILSSLDIWNNTLPGATSFFNQAKGDMKSILFSATHERVTPNKAPVKKVLLSEKENDKEAENGSEVKEVKNVIYPRVFLTEAAVTAEITRRGIVRKIEIEKYTALVAEMQEKYPRFFRGNWGVNNILSSFFNYFNSGVLPSEVPFWQMIPSRRVNTIGELHQATNWKKIAPEDQEKMLNFVRTAGYNEREKGVSLIPADAPEEVQEERELLDGKTLYNELVESTKMPFYSSSFGGPVVITERDGQQVIQITIYGLFKDDYYLYPNGTFKSTETGTSQSSDKEEEYELSEGLIANIIKLLTSDLYNPRYLPKTEVDIRFSLTGRYSDDEKAFER
ncbi:MAG: hypothetical protein WCJ84_05345 [Candidatus Peregrinibacteria bacterium]